MRVRGPQQALIATLVVGIGLGVRVTAWPLVSLNVPPITRAAPSSASVAPHLATDSLAAVAVSRDAFRFARHPAPVAYDPLRLAEQLAPRPAKPVLQLAGIVWDKESPAALIEGIPGVEGPRVLRVGETVSGLSVKQIAPDRVVMVGMDTVWVLKVKAPWK